MNIIAQPSNKIKDIRLDGRNTQCEEKKSHILIPRNYKKLGLEKMCLIDRYLSKRERLEVIYGERVKV